jgi:hypothetical protein
MSISDLRGSYEYCQQLQKMAQEKFGKNIDPWDFENYGKSMQKCLAIIEPIAKRTLLMPILKEAYYIKTNPLFYYGHKIVEYGTKTQLKAHALTELFEKVCKESLEQDIASFSDLWIDFVAQIDSDRQIALDYFSNQNKF